jgi:hypothetical protein
VAVADTQTVARLLREYAQRTALVARDRYRFSPHDANLRLFPPIVRLNSETCRGPATISNCH